MEIKKLSSFKDPVSDLQWFENWVLQVEKNNQRTYQRITVNTSLGKTRVWALTDSANDREPIVIFPGARTSVLFWDLNGELEVLKKDRNIYLVETNGLPNNSDGATPDIKSNNFGHWANEVLDGINLGNVFIAGASFGGLICMKLCLTNPERVNAAFLLNPGCLQPFSLTLKNLYYNILPIVSPSRKM